MNGVFLHLRNKLIAGLFAAIPLGICVYLAVWIETHTSRLTEPLGFHFPGLGVLLLLAVVYLLGLVVTSLVGKFLLRLLDRILARIPGLNLLIRAWKDVLVVSPEQSGMFHQAVLVPLDGQRYQLGFTSGRPLPGDAERLCVFLPDLPNPFSGRLMIVRRGECVALELSVEEALKYQFSSGNYLPAGLAASRNPSAG